MIALEEAAAAMKAALWLNCPCHAAFLRLDFKGYLQNKIHPLDCYLASNCDPLSLFNGAGEKKMSVSSECRCSEVVGS